MKAISFMSENTAAYALVPDIVAHLSEHFTHVIPVYFWSTREGSRLGIESMVNQTVRVIGAYARRPKVIQPGDDKILVKINELLFSAAREGAEFGIPVFAGVPCVNSLADFFLGVKCSWFHIEGTSQAVNDCEFMLHVTSQSSMTTLQQGISGPLTSEEIIKIAESQCRVLHWMEAAEGMKSVKSPEGMHLGPFGGGYRPFFLVIPSNYGNAPTRV